MLEELQKSLVALADEATTQSKSETPDLAAVAEKWSAFQDKWVPWKIDQLEKEENPDGKPARKSSK